MVVLPGYNFSMTQPHGDSGANGSTPVCDSGKCGFETRLSPEEYWLAGLLEGEGSFLRHRGGHDGQRCPAIRVQMTDRDVVERIAAMWGVSVVALGKRFDHHKPVFCVKTSGYRGADWMRRLRPLMGERRKGQIDAALEGWVPTRRYLQPFEETELVAAFRDGARALALAARYGITRELSLIHI